jgi:hypothetical protein
LSGETSFLQVFVAIGHQPNSEVSKEWLWIFDGEQSLSKPLPALS